jgi:hypothetical protein
MIASIAKKAKAGSAEPVAHLTQVTDAMHALVVRRVDS